MINIIYKDKKTKKKIVEEWRGMAPASFVVSF